MKKLLFKLCLVIVVFLIVSFLLSDIAVPKWISGNNPQTLQMDDFEKLEKDSLDVLVLGSCQSYQGFNPAILWETHGLTSYVLASPDQRLYVAYEYLQYALETQKPKVVLLETLMLTLTNKRSDTYDTKAVYSIRDRKFRYHAQDEIFERHYTGDKTLPQYYFDKAVNSIQSIFPVFVFNTTFDFATSKAYYLGECNNSTYNGGVPVYVHLDASELSNYMKDNSGRERKLNSIADEYFRKIVDLCKENNIELVLFKTLSPLYWSNDCYRMMADYAESFDLDYIDFNVDTDAYGLNLSQHLYTAWKLNVDGMNLTTQHLGNYLTEHYSSLFTDEKTERTKTFYDDMTARYHQAYEAATWSVDQLK